MEFKINDLSLTEREVEITYAYDEIKTDVESEVRKQTKKIQLPGFRKGKVPLPLLKKMYGDAFEQEASEKVANNKFWEVAEEKHFHPLGRPTLTEINFKPGEDLNFKVKYEVIPKLEVKDYTGLEIEVPDYKVKETDIESEIDYILKANRNLEPAEIISENRDNVLDVEFTRINENGEPFPGTKKESLQIDLSNEGVHPEIIENSKGKKKGDTFTFSFTEEKKIKNDKGEEEKVPEKLDYSAFIKDIKKIVLPELTEEFIKKVTKDRVSSEPQLREDISKDIQKYYDQTTDDLIRSKLIDLIVKNNDFTPPTAMVASVLEDLIKNEEEQAKKQGYGKIDKNEATNRLRKSAEYNVKWFLIKDAIQKKEDIKITDDEINELAAKDAEKTGIAVEKLVNYYKSSNHGEKIIDEKLFDFLKEKNTINKFDPDKLKQKEAENKEVKAEQPEQKEAEKNELETEQPEKKEPENKETEESK